MSDRRDTENDTEFEAHLRAQLRERADRTRVAIDPTRVTGRRRMAAGRPGWLVPALAFGVTALVVGGLLALAAVRGGDTTPPVVATEAPPPPPPPPPTYGVLDESVGPTIQDHWHVAYGFSLCGEWFQLSGDLEDVDAQGNFVDEAYLRTGIHSHDDGVIHIHPFTAEAEGDNATLGLFLSNYGVELTDEGFTAPPDQLVGVRCGTADKDLVVVVWPDATDPTEKLIVTNGLASTPLRDGAAITIALTDDPDTLTPPPWAAELPALGALDGAQVRPDDLLTTVAPEPPVTTAPPSMAPTGPIVDFAQCGQPVAAPASDLGVVTESIRVEPDGGVIELTLRNTTADPITVGVAPFLTTLGDDGTVASRPAELGVWGYQVMPPDEPFVYAVPGEVGVVACAATAGGTGGGTLATGSYEFVAILDVAGEIVATDPVVLDVDSDGAVSGGDSRSD
jgi:hypothetical protein